MIYFERFRSELGRYKEGVHELGAPLVGKSAVPPALAELYASYNGLRLFFDSVVVWPAAAVVVDGAFWRIGEWFGDALWMDALGRLYFSEDPDGDRVCVGSTVERWLGATMAR